MYTCRPTNCNVLHSYDWLYNAIDSEMVSPAMRSPVEHFGLTVSAVPMYLAVTSVDRSPSIGTQWDQTLTDITLLVQQHESGQHEAQYIGEQPVCHTARMHGLQYPVQTTTRLIRYIAYSEVISK